MSPTPPRTSSVLALGALAVLAATSCGERDAQAAPLASAPRGLETVDLVIPEDNSLTAEKALLGKVLFFDKRLSSDGTMACQSCHLHENGWTDGQRFSQKVGGAMNTRNSPTLYNVGYQNLYYWDGRAPSMEANVTAAWKGHMGGDPEAMAATLEGIESYRQWFDSAFGTAPTGDNIVKALTSFVRTLRSGDSDFDRGTLSAAAERGKAIYQQRCVQCHTAPLFTDLLFHNVGAGEKPDEGRGAKVEDPKMAGAFKTPSLRSVTKTAPYFHDGSIATLREAVAFMYRGGNAVENRDPILDAVQKLHDDETPEQREKNIDDLVEFVKALEGRDSFVAPKVP